MTIVKPAIRSSSPKLVDNNNQDASSFHWGSFLPTSPKMQQLLKEHEALHPQENDKLPSATKK